MRQRLAVWLRRLAAWCDRIPDPLLDRTAQLVREADQSFPVEHGEAKRHWVYSRLQKDFPSTVKSAIGLAIELAVRDR